MQTLHLSPAHDRCYSSPSHPLCKSVQYCEAATSPAGRHVAVIYRKRRKPDIAEYSRANRRDGYGSGL